MQKMSALALLLLMCAAPAMAQKKDAHAEEPGRANPSNRFSGLHPTCQKVAYNNSACAEEEIGGLSSRGLIYRSGFSGGASATFPCEGCNTSKTVWFLPKHQGEILGPLLRAGVRWSKVVFRYTPK